MCNHHCQLFPILFVVFNDGFIIEIMIVLYCVYINTTIYNTNILQYISILSFLVSKLLSLKALDPIISFAGNTNHKNYLPTTIFVRLDRDNYLLWKSLVLPLIRGCKLDGYILEIKECPKLFLTTSDKTQKTNPYYEEWIAQD